MHHRFNFRQRGNDSRHRSARPGLVDFHSTLLTLLADQPHFGYEFVREAIETPRGDYTLSPSLVYPTLTYLEEIGHIMAIAEGARTRYEITDAGREHLKTLHADPERRRRGMRDSSGWWSARSALKDALRGSADASAEEQQRIVKILQRATAEILGNPAN